MRPPELFDKVWQFDVDNNLISIGWSQLGDVSKMSRETLAKAVADKYPEKPAATRGLYANMLWAFYHDIRPGDFVIARRGRKTLTAIGKVIEAAEYAPKRNPLLASPDHSHHSFLGVEWQNQPRDKVFPTLVFPMHTLSEFSEVQYHSLWEGNLSTVAMEEPPEPVEDQSEFVWKSTLKTSS